ncbi:2,5-furandicarboxylate decarboxylase 1 [Desulfotomaculum arcticum]|uniref:2,5-furandicarboxylate decarboxylase 1 n=1 Tax=Desulfotruncus arcticus DSM 17038 TaxID=1121424 RepID=A0A1I2YN74_9FIRM|nr:UbiD family decarboxylase [Desulfotruncus arcticus]SFH27063.1 2,5-furandicarboxylate decarboxylase 1 [Desulfotomaculum arcticum] [Desulfotruncus arcticus DSM 17038]
MMSMAIPVKQASFDLNMAIEYLTQNNGLVKVGSEVDIYQELAGVAKCFEGRQTVLFERVKGQDYPVFTGLYWNRELLAGLFGCDGRRLPFLLRDAVQAWQQSPIHPVVVDRGPANKVVEPVVDLTGLPVPVHALQDGGAYFTCSVVIAKDPDTGVRNASVNRIMVTGKNRLAMLMDVGRHLRHYYERAEKAGKPLEITISNGVDPTVYMAAVVPAASAPIDKDELGIASHLLGRPLELLRSQIVAVEGVANAQFVIEGEILPGVREPEGPFAEVTGYYAERAPRWVVNVKAVTRRKKPVFHTLMPGKEVFNSVGIMGEANIFDMVSRQVPGVQGVHLTTGGCGFYHAVVQIAKQREGMQRNAILATFAAFPSLKQVTVVDEDVNIYDPDEVEWAMATRFRADKDILVIPDAFGHELNPCTRDGLTAKAGFDATTPYPRPDGFTRVSVKPVNIKDYHIE